MNINFNKPAFCNLEKNNRAPKIVYCLTVTLFFVFLFNPVCYSQQKSKLDSLIGVFNKTKVDSNKVYLAKRINRIIVKKNPNDTTGLIYLVSAYNYLKSSKNLESKYDICSSLAYSCFFLNRYEEALQYNKEALLVAKSQKSEENIIYILDKISMVYGVLRKHDEAEKCILEAIELAKKTNKKFELGSLYNGLAGQNLSLGNYETAIKYFYQSLTVYESLKDTNFIISLLKNTSMAYESLKDYNRSRELLFRAYKLAYAIKDSNYISDVSSSLGTMYQDLHNLDSALYYNKKQVAFLDKQKNPSDLGMAYGNLGIIYRDKKDFVNAEKYMKDALEIFKKVNSYRLISISLINLSELYYLERKYNEAIKLMNEVLKQGEESHEVDILIAGHQGRYQAYEGMKRYKEALEEYRIYKSLDDSVRKEKSITKVMRMESEYEMGKKQKENELLKAQNKVRETVITISKEKEKSTKLLLYGSLFVTLIIMALAVLLLIGLRKNKLQNSIITNQKKLVEEKNKDITDSINYAKKIQEALLPSKEIKYEIFPNAFVLFKPRDIVSGDFYWFTSKNGKRIITAVDCTGHGVPGAFMSMIGNTFLNEIIEESSITEPGAILSELRHMVIKSLKQSHDTSESKDGMDMALIAFDDKNNLVEFAGANNPLWIIRNDACIEYNGDKRPIGFYRGEGLPFTNHKIEIQKGDTLYVFTDGYADQFGGPKGKKFKYKQFLEILISIQNEPMLKQEEILLQRFNEWKGELEQIDDVLVIGVRI